MKLIYAGTPEIAAVIMERLLKEDDLEIVLAITQPDRPKGRSGELSMSPVKQLALKENIPVFQPERIRDEEAVAYLNGIEADIIVVAAFGQILPKEILWMKRLGSINVHASLLPKYRGAAPIQWAIIDGEKETGITIIQMNEGLDTGDMLLKKKISISPDETGGSLHDRLAVLGGEAAVEVLSLLKEGEISGIPQGEATTHYASMLNKKMGRLNLGRPAEELERYVRGLNPWPSAYVCLDGKMVKLWECMVAHNVPDGTEPGEVYGIDKNGFYIATGDGGLRVLRLQAEGKRAMTAAEFLRGNELYGKRFE